MLPNKKLYLNECGIKKCKNPLHGNQIISVIANVNNHDEKVAAFLVKTCKHFASVVDDEQMSALHQAAMVGRYQLVEWLIKNGANVNLKHKPTGFTALHYAIEFGNINVAVLLQIYESSLEILDVRRKIPLMYLTPYGQKKIFWKNGNYIFKENVDEDLSEILVWGSNKNYNLGISVESSESIPQHLDYFKKNHIYIRDISMSMYHTMFLDSIGNIHTVGHGKGGRLGMSVENSLVVPTQVKINFKDRNKVDKIISFDAGKYHSIILTQSDTVYVTGLNTYFQLGIKPSPEKLLTFKPVFVEKEKLSPRLNPAPFSNVMARDYHSMVYSKNEIYVWGLNGGQFGLKNKVDTTIPTKIDTFGYGCTLVESSNSTIACYSQNAQIILLYNKYKISRVRTPSSESIRLLAIKGGDFIPTSNVTLSKQENIELIVITTTDNVFIWYEDIHKFVKYDNKHYHIQSIKWFHQSILMLADDFIYIGDINRKVIKCDAGNNKITGASADGGDEYRETTYIRREIADNEQIDLNIKRIPLVDRVQMVTCNPECKSFICMQLHSRHHLEIPQLTIKEFNFKSLLFESSQYDRIHDIVFHVEDEKFLAHKFIVFSRAPGLRNIVNQFTDKHVHLQYEYFTSKMLDLILKYIYTNRMLTSADVEDIELSLMVNSGLDNLEIFSIFREYVGKFGLSKFASTMVLSNYVNGSSGSSSKNVTCQNVPKLNRNAFPELYDVKIICTGGVEIKAHKCVLVTRLEYFRMMFQNTWAETNKVNFPTVAVEYMTTILEFIYTNDVDYIRSQKYSEKYMYNMLIICDQFIMCELREIFEILLIEKISIKKCQEMLEFAIVYNCKHLETAALQFICYNMGRVLDARALDYLDTIYLTKITEFYKETVLRNHYCKFNDADDDDDDVINLEINLDSICDDFHVDLTRKYFDDDKIKKNISIDQMQQERLNCERDGKESLLLNALKEQEIEEQQHQQQKLLMSTPNTSSITASNCESVDKLAAATGAIPKLKLENTTTTKWTKVEEKKDKEIISKKNKTISLLAGLHSNEILKNENVKQNEFVNLNNFNKIDSNQQQQQQQQQQQPSSSKLSVIGSESNLIPMTTISSTTNEVPSTPINLGTFILSNTKNFERLSQKQRKRYLSESATTGNKSIHSGKTDQVDDDKENYGFDNNNIDDNKLSKSLSSALVPKKKISNESFANIIKCENNNKSVSEFNNTLEDVQESLCGAVGTSSTPIKFIVPCTNTVAIASTSSASLPLSSPLSPSSPSSSSFPKLTSIFDRSASSIHKNSKSKEFTEILKDERKQRDYFEKSTKKSLRLTQLEETAISELSRFYNVDNVYDERIQIDRRQQYVNPTLNFASWQKSGN